jgi:D-sedoheptulose 7-phosphate isomerase
MDKTAITQTEKVVVDVDLAIAAVSQLRNEKNLQFMRDVARELIRAFRAGGKVIVAGNGGSLCDAAHFAEECTGFFSKNRRPALPAIALTEPGHITCTANDIGYEWVFARGVEAYGREGDLFIGLSTSGNSLSIIKAFEVAKEMGLRTCAFLGKDGGSLHGVADYELVISGFQQSDRVQEAHMAAMHIIIGLVEEELFPQPLGLHESLLQNYIERKKRAPL